jgi:hypothetical protein
VPPRSQIPVPTLLPQSSDWHRWGILGDFLVFRCGLHHFWIVLNLVCICLHLFVAGGHLLAGFLETLCLVVNVCHDVFSSHLFPL